MCLRAQFDESLVDCARWWTEVQELDHDDQIESVAQKPVVVSNWGDPPKKKRRGRKFSRRRRNKSHND